jgi:ankyrin repeat protein
MRPGCSDGRRSWRDGGRTWPTREPSRCFEVLWPDSPTRPQGAKVKPVKSLVEMNEDVSTVPVVTRRVTRSQTREGNSAAVRETSVGEDVIFCKLIRDGILRHLNPWKPSDLHCVLEMRCFKGLLSDEDLKEVYFQRMWGFKDEWGFVLAGWLELSVQDMKWRIQSALEHPLNRTPGMREHLMALETKEEIMREYGMLAYVPRDIAYNAMCSVLLLRQVRGVGVENLGSLEFEERKQCFWHACSAGVDFSIIRSLYESLSAVHRLFSGGEGLVNAARGGHLNIVEAFIGTLGVDVDAIDHYGDTALMRAVVGRHRDIVNALAGTHNANVEAVNRDGRTALMFAARNGHTDTVNALAGTHNANVEAVDLKGRTALMLAAWNGHTATVNALAGTYNAKVEAVDQDGMTALMRAALEGHTDIVNALAGTYNANVEAVDQGGWTALMHAAWNGHTDTVNALAGTYNANVEAVDLKGRTALMLAATNGHTDTVEALRALGASRKV